MFVDTGDKPLSDLPDAEYVPSSPESMKPRRSKRRRLEPKKKTNGSREQFIQQNDQSVSNVEGSNECSTNTVEYQSDKHTTNEVCGLNELRDIGLS
jgi:hypothetical protein